MGQNITLTASDGHQLDAYLANPAGDAKGRLVVVQEIFGVNSHIRDVCDGYAERGYVALAPAMFDRLEKNFECGYDAEGVAAGRELKGRCPWPEAALDIEAARAHLAGDGTVAIVGYCWGGSLAWLGATEGGYCAAVGYYGGQIIELNDRQPQCPVLLHFGELDGGIPLSDVDKIAATHPEVTIHVYEGADHGFNCDQRGSYNEASAKLALGRTLEHFASVFG